MCITSTLRPGKNWAVSKNKIINLFMVAKGIIPIPRAAHAACSFNENQLIIYGGATGCKLGMII